MQQPPQELVTKAEAAGLSWEVFLKLYEAVTKYGPDAVLLIKKLLDFFSPQVFGTHSDECKQLCCDSLCKAIQSCCSLSKLHEQLCCKD